MIGQFSPAGGCSATRNLVMNVWNVKGEVLLLHTDLDLADALDLLLRLALDLLDVGDALLDDVGAHLLLGDGGLQHHLFLLLLHRGGLGGGLSAENLLQDVHRSARVRVSSCQHCVRVRVRVRSR